MTPPANETDSLQQAGREPLLWWQPETGGQARRVRSIAIVSVVTVVFAVLFGWAVRALDPAGWLSALLLVWLPMTWLGSVSHFIGMQLPARYHAIRHFERDGRFYERLGVRFVKRVLRRRPFAWFNGGLHLPAERTRVELAALARRMRTAETTHTLLFVVTLPLAAHAAWRGDAFVACLTLALDVAINGYPAMLQRYNRALLELRFDGRSGA